MSKVIIDLDDFAMGTPCLDILENIKQHYPNFKCTLFTVPMEPGLLSSKTDMKKYVEWVDLVNSYDWIEVAVHGFLHDKKEMMGDYESSQKVIMAAERMFKEVKHKERKKYFGFKWYKYKTNMNYVKVFKAPGWQMSQDAYRAARDKGYVVAVDRNEPTPEIEGLETYKYNWSIEEPFPTEYKVVKGHGHVIGMANSIRRCYMNLLNMPQNVEFLTINEYLNERRSTKTN